MPSFRFLAPALLALARRGAPAASAQSFSDAQRGDIETIVKNYLIAHPEVLEEAMAELSKRQAAAETEKHQATIAKNGETISNRNHCMSHAMVAAAKEFLGSGHVSYREDDK